MCYPRPFRVAAQFDALVDEALAVEKELRALSGDKPSIRGWVSACLSRGGLCYEDIEAVKERLGGDFLHTRMVDSGAYARDLRKYIVGGSLKEPPRPTGSSVCFLPKETALSPSLEASRRCYLPWSRS